ncbi:MAG: dihydroorotate dehydrogenase electron transfer subunit [Solirubrobacterales bacterium]
MAGSRPSGGYRLLDLLDPVGPEPLPGQFYMLAAETGWGADAGRPFLPRAISVAEASGEGDAVRLAFLLSDAGPGTARLCAMRPGEMVALTGPLGRPFSAPGELNPGCAGAILVGGGIGIAPLALLRRRLSERGSAVRTLLGFRDRAHSGGVEELFGCSEVRLASEDGHAGHRGYVTDLLSVLLAGDDAATAAIYACGPAAMLDAVREMCGDRGTPCELALEAPMACGFGACFGCAVPLREGGYLRLCVDGPVVRGDRIASASPQGAPG